MTCTATFTVTPDVTAPTLTSAPYTDPISYNTCYSGALAAVPAWSATMLL
ncbi:MAG: hypothetical protein IPH84_05185 [Bacteroidales bacterium]|nr:hypothetical protein [Bacteroidales bacterium]